MANKTRNRIAEAYSAIMSEVPAELGDLPFVDAGMGVTDDLNEVIWTGQLGPDEWDRMLDEIIKVEALGELLRAIIEAHEIEDPRAKSRRTGKPLADYRREQALKLLIGYVPLKGRPREVPDAKLKKAVDLYLSASFAEPGAPRSIRAVAHAAEGADPDLDEKAKDDLSRPVQQALLRRKETLLVRRSAEGLPAVETPKLLVQALKRGLAQLGLVDPNKVPG